jgi:hypothetical protein
MTAAVYDIAIEEGATFRFPKFQFGTLLVDANGEPILDADGNQQIDVGRDFTGCKFRVQIRKRKRPDAEILITITSEDTDGGISADNEGNVVIVVPDEMTDKVVSNGYWDLKCYNPNQTEDRLVEGSVAVNRAVTVDAAL